jgi:hypothetical protein
LGGTSRNWNRPNNAASAETQKVTTTLSTPLVGEEAATRAAFDLHSLFTQLGPLRPTDRQYEPFKQLIERFLNVTNHQLALHLEFTKAVTNLLPVLTESADLIDKFAECVL